MTHDVCRIPLLLVLFMMSCAHTPCQPLAESRRPPAPTGGICDVAPEECLTSGPFSPRCLATDPSCGPEPLRSFTGCYRPEAKRTVVLQLSQDRGNTCRHDGECAIVGCGNTCAPYTYYGILTNCLEPVALEDNPDSLCGCVEGRCAFFVQ